MGAPRGGTWSEILNSDAPLYGGSGQGNIGGASAAPLPIHGRSHLLNITLPPLGMLVFKNPAAGSVDPRAAETAPVAKRRRIEFNTLLHGAICISVRHNRTHPNLVYESTARARLP